MSLVRLHSQADWLAHLSFSKNNEIQFLLDMYDIIHIYMFALIIY